MIDKEIDEKEGEKLKSIYIHYVNKQDKIKKTTQFKVEEVFGKIIPKDFISPEQITKPNVNNVNVYFSLKMNLFEPRKKNKKL